MPYLGDLGAALLLGLAGAAHCVGMCGGIVSALALRSDNTDSVRLALAYNAGRIFSYAVLGAAAGSVVAVLTPSGWPIARTFAGAILILMGLYLGGWSTAIIAIERFGGLFWLKLKPLAGRWLPVRDMRSALMVGIFWGWLPCGLTYSALAFAASQANLLGSGLTMAAFGLGTLPALLASGVILGKLRGRLQGAKVRKWLAIAYIAFGVWTAMAPWYHRLAHDHGSSSGHSSTGHSINEQETHSIEHRH